VEIVVRALVVFLFLWLVTRAAGRSTLGELSTFELLLYVTMGDLVQQAVTQQDYSVTAGLLAISTITLLTVAISWLQWRVRALRPAISGRPVLVLAHGKPLEHRMRRQRLSLEDLLMAAREQGIKHTAQIEYAVLESDGKMAFFTYDEGGESGAPESGPPAS
jgi:uncharacterized membrane protein YcaP (DUF421 family)